MKTFKKFITEEDDTFEHMFQLLDLKVYTVNMNTDQISIVDVDILDIDTFISTYNQYINISKRLAFRTPEGEITHPEKYKTIAFYDNSLTEIIEWMKQVGCVNVRYYASYNNIPTSVSYDPYHNGMIYFALTRDGVVKKVISDMVTEFYHAGYNDDEADREAGKLLNRLKSKFDELE